MGKDLAHLVTTLARPKKSATRGGKAPAAGVDKVGDHNFTAIVKQMDPRASSPRCQGPAERVDICHRAIPARLGVLILFAVTSYNLRKAMFVVALPELSTAAGGVVCIKEGWSFYDTVRHLINPSGNIYSP